MSLIESPLPPSPSRRLSLPPHSRRIPDRHAAAEERHGNRRRHLQPVEMEPEGTCAKASESDIHIEADIHALANNPNGFEEGAWIPLPVVKFEVSKIGGDFKNRRRLHADGGQRRPALRRQHQARRPRQIQGEVHHPAAVGQPARPFGRHTDRATGVRPWFKPFDVEYEFTYVGIGKKGGY